MIANSRWIQWPCVLPRRCIQVEPGKAPHDISNIVKQVDGIKEKPITGVIFPDSAPSPTAEWPGNRPSGLNILHRGSDIKGNLEKKWMPAVVFFEIKGGFYFKFFRFVPMGLEETGKFSEMWNTPGSGRKTASLITGNVPRRFQECSALEKGRLEPGKKAPS